MSQTFHIHPHNPQRRLLEQASNILREGKLLVYPTDCAYAIGCKMGDKESIERMRRIKQLDEEHYFTVLCRDLSQLAQFAHVDNQAFRFLKSHIPGAYTFLLPASKEVPKRLLHAKRKSIGLRVPDNKVILCLLEILAEPILSTTLQLPDDDFPRAHLDDLPKGIYQAIDAWIDAGTCSNEVTTILDLTSWPPQIVREGKGSIEDL